MRALALSDFLTVCLCATCQYMFFFIRDSTYLTILFFQLDGCTPVFRRCAP